MGKRLTKAGVIVWLIFLLGLEGYGTEGTSLEETVTESEIAEEMATEEGSVEKATELTTEETATEEEETRLEESEEAGIEVQFVSGQGTDYDKLRETGHVILAEDICQSPTPIHDNPWLLEQLATWLEEWKIDDDDIVDYFTFDLNDDGIEEYITSLDGVGLSGSAGNLVEIWRKDEKGDLELFFGVVSRLHVRDHEYASLTVLEETLGGYHSIVFPESFNRIWYYDEESGSYDTSSGDGVDYDRCTACLKEQIPELGVWAEYVEQEGGEETKLEVEIDFKFYHIYTDDVYMGSYYPVWAWQDHNHNTLFFVSMEYDEVLWGGPEGMRYHRIYTLDEWRTSSEYPDLGRKAEQ